MIAKKVTDCKEFVAQDMTILREVFHPKNDNIDTSFSIAHAKLDPGNMSKPHKLNANEVYYILKGEGVICISDKLTDVKEGSVIFVPPNQKQYMKNTGSTNLEFLQIVDPPWKRENEKLA